MLSVTEGEVVKCCAKWQSYEIHTLTLEVYLHSKIYQGLPPGPAQENPKETRIEIDIGLYTQGPIFTVPKEGSRSACTGEYSGDSLLHLEEE